MKMLLNCFKNLDKQVKELYILAQSNNEKHIKGEKQLLDLTESINFMIYQKNLMIMKKIGLKRKN